MRRVIKRRGKKEKRRKEKKRIEKNRTERKGRIWICNGRIYNKILQTMYSFPRFFSLGGLPLHLPGSCLEHPKSASLATPASVTRTFAPLISLDGVKIKYKKKTWEKKKCISKEVEKWTMKESKMRSETGNLNCDQNSNTECLNEKDKDGDRIHCILKERQYIY